MKITYCPPADAAGDALDDVIFFLRCGFPPSTARLLGRVYRDVCSGKVSDKMWEALQAYTLKNSKYAFIPEKLLYKLNM